jgi:nucleoside-diphosphate-sugar epimerase
MKSVALSQLGTDFFGRIADHGRPSMSDTRTALPAPRGEEELEELLSEPTPETTEAATRLNGDVIVLGAGGKMGPSLAVLAKRSIDAAGAPHRVICVSRFSTPEVPERLRSHGIETIACDLLERENLDRLPDAPNILYLAGMKFGTSGEPHLTWALNCHLPAIIAERFREAKIVALSTGNVYPLVPVSSGGADETTPTDPVGEYAQSCLGRERMFQYMSSKHGTPVLLVRLNYATDLRYGVLLDVAQKVHRGDPVDLSMSWVNTIWQGDANAVLLRAFDLCASPPQVLNVTGPELVSIREAALRFAVLLGRPASFAGTESESALLSDASRCHTLFGKPRVSFDTLIDWTAEWVRTGMPTLEKPTHYETRDGRF